MTADEHRRKSFLVFLGQTRDPVLIKRLNSSGLTVGECTVRGELPARRRPWFHDNGAFRDWKADRPFDVVRWQRDMRCIRDRIKGVDAPVFIVVPDRVAAGVSSLEWSRMWRDEIPEGHKAYLAVQDGMTHEAVATYLKEAASMGLPYAGIFVGGTLPWKLEHAHKWTVWAQNHWGLKSHIGRVGTPDRLRWAFNLGADSVDSCLPLMHEEHLLAFLFELRAIREGR